MDEVSRLKRLVETENACALPGCTIVYERFVPALQRAMSRGYVKAHHGLYVLNGLRHGFDLGVSPGSLRGRRRFKNYKSAYENHASVDNAISSRLERKKSICIGMWNNVRFEFESTFEDYFIFPMGAVPKPSQPDVYRPTSDHTRTGFNAATVMGILKHSLDSFNQMCHMLERGYFLYVSDVDDAFTLIPLAPRIWPFMCLLWPLGDLTACLYLILHLFADFGTRGMPGTFKVFLVDVVVQMARSEFIITLPITIYVDDAGLVGSALAETTEEMLALQDFTSTTCGVLWKQRKDRPSAQVNLFIGFNWNSRVFTISLEEHKLKLYLEALLTAAHSSTLSLKERQSLAGKMQRGIRTLPPGAACLLANCYAMSTGLVMGWQQRRTTRAERLDYLYVHDLLELNLGMGYYRYDDFSEGPTCLSDASKSRALTGGGYVCADGFYDLFQYSGAAKRRPIDFLEGDVVRRCCTERCAGWKGLMIPFGIDNQAFERSAEKGRSRAERLNTILKSLFALQVRYVFILQPFWISTHDNYLADDLSRDREDQFLGRVADAGLLQPGAQLQRHPEAGRTVNFSEGPLDAMAALRQTTKHYSSNCTGDGPSRGAGVGGDAQLLSLSYTPASIFVGLLPQFVERADEVFDQRLAASSMSKVMSGFRRWEKFSNEHGLPVLIESGHPNRGGWLASWVLQMVDDTELVYDSIATYVWGVRTWHVLQHHDDPAFGVKHWREWMHSVAVLTAVPGEPREQVPLDVLRDVLSRLDFDKFEDVQFGLACLVLVFTFSRAECPCPKNFTGPQSFDPAKHWMWKDFKLVKTSGGWVLWVRFKGFKQDPRIQRPEASHSTDALPFDGAPEDNYGRDWVPIGDVDDPLFSISRWFMRHTQLLGRVRQPDEPMFLARDTVRPYTYSALLADFTTWVRGTPGASRKLAPHGLRVLGYNLSKHANGVDLTVAHGGWRSLAHDRYERFQHSAILSIPARMLGVASSFEENAVREISRDRRPRGAAAVGDAADLEEPGADGADEAGPPAAPEAGLPDGYTVAHRTTASGRNYMVVCAPDGSNLPSRPAAWRHYLARAPSAVASPPLPSSAATTLNLLILAA